MSQAERLARRLSGCPPWHSSTCVLVEDLVVISLFAPGRTPSANTQAPQTLGLTFPYSGHTLVALYEEFEAVKHLFTIVNRDAHLNAAKRIRLAGVRRRQPVVGGDRGLRALTHEQQEFMEW